MKKLIILILIMVLFPSCYIYRPIKPAIYELRVKFCELLGNPINPDDMFTKRAYHSISGYTYLIGGAQDGITGLNDVWYSSNESKWTLKTSNAGFAGRWAHTSVIMDNKIWVIGGTPDGTTGLNDVWYSEDGVDWILATGNAEFSGRWGHTSIVKEDKIWVIGGTPDGTTGLNDVWYSENGADWVLARSNAGFTGRWYHASIVHTGENNILVIGGTKDGNSGLNDVWYSDNGIEWKKATENAEFGKRHSHKCELTVDFEDYLLVIGGRNNNEYYKDIWCSEDKKTWKKMEHNCPFNPMAGFGLSQHSFHINIYGGYDGNNYLNNQWYISFDRVVVD